MEIIYFLLGIVLGIGIKEFIDEKKQNSNDNGKQNNPSSKPKTSKTIKNFSD